MADEDQLKVYWEHFFKAETGTYEKSTWLDLFLAEFLIRLNEGANPKELINFCPISGVVSLVGCELLCGIHRVTSSINAHYTPLPCLDAPCSARDTPDDKTEDGKSEDSRSQASSLFTRSNQQSSGEILRKYLLGGVAWRGLLLLQALGVEGLSCCRQLSSVLIWLFGELRGGDVSEAPRPSKCSQLSSPRTPIHMLFSHKIWSKQKLNGNQAKVNSNVSSDKGSFTGRSRRISQIKSDSESKVKRKQAKHSDQSSESGDSTQDLQILNRSLAVKLPPPADFQYFDSPVKSPRDYHNDTLYTDPYYTPPKPKPKADDYMNDKHREIIASEITTFEFTLLITDLLQELCKTESSLSGSEGSQISVQCINFSLRNICSLQFGSLPQSQYDNLEVSKIKVALTELLIVSLDKVLVHSDLCAKLINNGILPMLLRLLEDVICKSSSLRTKDELNRAKVESDETESANLIKFVFGIAYSITAFFHCLLMQCRSVDKLREFTDQFKLYGECLKGGLLKECIEIMIRIPSNEDDIVILIKKLIESIGKLINGMKKIRSEVVHSAACPRSRHKVCRQRVAAGMHHHHDILGEAGTGLPLSSACCISVLYGTLTSLLTDEEVSAHTVLRNKILRVMLSSGACCCFSPGFLMENVVRLMLTHNSVATLCLQVLEHTVYGELGASILVPKVTDQLPCAICEPCDDKRDLVRKYCPHGVSPIERKSVWSFLIHYNSLLQLDNHNNVLHATVSHLLRVTPKCRMEMKYELLFSVIYPTFIVAKHRYIIRLEESAYFLTVSCLNIFASLLNTVSFAEQFIQKGGLSYVLELVSLSEFSNQCCSILEIAIIVEIFKLMKENSQLTYYREISSLASVQMLFKSLADMTSKCYRIYKLKLPSDKFEELCDLSKERETLGLTQNNPYESRKLSIPQAIRTTFASSENVIEDSVEDYIEVLKNVGTFWKSCAGLCLYSPMFRQYMAREGVFVDSYALLKLLLYCLCVTECSAGEMRVIIRIVEAILTVQFALSDVTSDRSKTASSTLVREAVNASTLGAAENLPRGGLRALCDALIRVCVSAPSGRHTMPRVPRAKVPPLGCPSGNSSPDGSSSEDSASGPYASEHSEPHIRPDEGYEADVEIGKLDALATYKLKKISALSNMSTITADIQRPVECVEYSKQGELAHPELCVIVVDILTQLINKLVGVEGAELGVQRTGAALALACCGRLARALTRARPAPPLLARLLPPAAALLPRTEPHLRDLQHSILELIFVLASQSIESSELAAYLKMFLHDAPPLTMLLNTLQRLVTAATPNTPDAILTFPIDIDNKAENDEMAESLGYVNISGATSQSMQAEALSRQLYHAHTRSGIKSIWSVGAVRVGVEGLGWAPWSQGFALCLWLRPATHTHSTHNNNLTKDDSNDWDRDTLEDQSEQESETKKSPLKEKSPSELMHVFSVGHDTLMFELWLDTSNGYLTFRLSRPEAASNKVMSETQIDAGLLSEQWSCVALNVKEVVHKRKIHIQVTLYVNGCECETVSLPLQGILVRKVSPTHVLAGHARAGGGGGRGAYHVSHVSLYRAPALSVYTALHLTAHGPDASCQVRCESPNFPLVLTPNVLDSNIDWDQVFEISGAALRELHDNLLLTFAAHAHHIMNLYHQTVAPPAVFSNRVTSGSLLGAGAGGGSEGGGCSIPEALAATWVGRALPSHHCALPTALYTLGGPDVLLYLFARVVELDGSAEEQAQALAILLRLCRVDNRLYSMLYGSPALDMLLTVLACHKCRLHHHMLRVILEEACNGPILTSSGGGLVVLARSDAVLLEPRLLVLITRAWRQLDTPQELSWEVEGANGSRASHRGSLWALTLCCMRVLVRDEHPRRAFNHYQVSRVGLLRQLLLACKERFLNSECGPLEQSASNSLVELVRGLMGSPPMLDQLALLCDLLLLMHQASDTFVTHSRANFYLLLTASTQDMSQLRARTHSFTDTRSSSSVTDDDLDERLHRSGSDDTKLLKGIINMHIKEGRKHNVSSTSENSDIVIDEDDVNHTTVEMYSSGIYQQRRVRAGAEPGWTACEGLLLLLRDAIGVLPDHALQQAVFGAIQTESLVVLANHRNASVRAALLRVVAALQRRATAELNKKLKLHHYYLHLANQITLYPGSWELATACAALLTKCDVPLEDQLDDDIWMELGEESMQRCPPLLALLPSCLHLVPLAHNITLIIRRVIDKASLKLLTEVSVSEVVVRTIRDTALLGDSWEGRDLLVEDLHSLLAKLAVKALNSLHNMQTITDLHHMLHYLEMSEEAMREGGSVITEAAREAQLSLYIAQLDYLEERLHSSYTAHTKYNNYFTTVLSSAVSLGSEAAARAERAELAARHVATVSRAVGFLLTLSVHSDVTRAAPLLDRLLATLLPAVSGANSRPKWWVSSSQDWVSPLQQLFWWAASPAPGVRCLQPRLLRALYQAPPATLQLLTKPEPSAMRKLAVYLLTIIKQIHAEAETGHAPVELAITDWARSWALGTQAPLPERLQPDQLAGEARRLLQADETRWARARHKMAPTIARVIFSKDSLASKLTETAMGITRQVVDIQNGERKSFMEHLRRAQSEAVVSTQRWQRLVDSHTHEQAVWHDPRGYPQSWELDDTEGPGRVRVRLRRAHLDILPRFLKNTHRYKTEAMQRPGPLRSVLSGSMRLRKGLVARLQLNETVSYMARVTHVTVARETVGELLLTDRCIHFVPEDSEDSADHKHNCEQQCGAQSWPLEGVVQVATRRWCLQERAAELFLSSGHAHLLAFTDLQERGAFLKALASAHLPNRVEPDTLQEAMNQWRAGTITNWEYLMRLNGLGGRSYNDLMQYPVLPFVIADYSSRILDLNDPASFRDLSKPMAIQNKNREQHYINTYNDLKAAKREGCSPLVSKAPHHYASLYSNSGGVLHYLVRLPPFTQLFLNYQDNNFDMPDRTFHSLATTWRLITNDSPTDVKELIPELFYLPELFHNNEGLELGVRQCGLGVDSVELPGWAADARLFTLAHRQALEAALVTEHLPLWIDLVFGCKQTGQPAIDAINVFPACTYYGFDPESLPDEVDRTAAAAMVRTYGQAPRQLLKHPHPHKPPDLQPATVQKSVWSGVEGARWGRYCGSPALGPAAVVARRRVAGAAALQALPQPRAAAVLPAGTDLLALPCDAGSGTASGPEPLALVSWRHSDSIVRLKRRRVETLLHVPPRDMITAVATSLSASHSGHVYVGHASGRVQHVRVAGTGGGGAARARARELHAHAAPLAALHVCVRAGLLASASMDGLIVLWDLNKLTYIRTLPNRDMLPVTHITISETLCDVASVHDVTKRGDVTRGDVTLGDVTCRSDLDDDSYERDATFKYDSLVRVHTVNAGFVGSVKVSERVTCICYSNAPEGISVNVVACGLESGAVRLYSSWDLQHVLTVPRATPLSPLLSITYSSDSSLLFGCYADGLCVAWESGVTGKPAPVRLLPAAALL